jgi:hypothetical protein
MFGSVNIESALKSIRTERLKKSNTEDSVLKGFKQLFEAEWEKENDITKRLALGVSDVTLLNGSGLPEHRKYGLRDIEKLCVKYRLRFLSTKHFKNEIPREAVAAVKQVEKTSGQTIKAFMIAAPAPMFNLTDANKDPLLFAPLEDGRFYLVHQWGKDLSPLRSILFWPLAQLSNLLITILALSLVLSAILPTGMFTKLELGYFNFYRIAFLAWNVAFLSGVVSYFWFVTHQKFSAQAWRNKFFN